MSRKLSVLGSFEISIEELDATEKRVIEIFTPLSSIELTPDAIMSEAFRGVGLETLGITNLEYLGQLNKFAGCELSATDLAQMIEPVRGGRVQSEIPLSYLIKYVCIAKKEASAGGDDYNPQDSVQLQEMLKACIPPDNWKNYDSSGKPKLPESKFLRRIANVLTRVTA